MSLGGTLGWTICALAAFNLVYTFYSWYTRSAATRFDRQFNEACAASGKERDALLARFCEECKRRSQKKPKDALLFHWWGMALWWRAARATGAKADSLYEQADKKFAQALAIAPNKGQICADRAEALRYRAALHPDDETGRRLLLQVCEQCERRVGIHFSGTQDARMFGIWGLALWWLAAKETGAEAKRLYQEADERFRRGYALDSGQTEMAVSRATALFWSSALYSGEERREMLARACRQCEELAGKAAGGFPMLVVWGRALCWLAATTKGLEAERVYAEAEDKFSRALAIASDSLEAATGRLRAMTSRAILQRGDDRRGLLARVCEECARLSGAQPDNAELLQIWGDALFRLGACTERPDADRCFADAADKFTLALRITPADETLTGWLALALRTCAKSADGENPRQLLTRAGELIETVLNKNPANYQMLNHWAGLLHQRARYMPGEETNRLLSDARQRFEAAARNGGDLDALLAGWGVVLSTQSACAGGEESARLLQEAKAKFVESEARVPGSAAYNLACICAQTGDVEVCRKWLEASGEPGIWVSRDAMDKQAEFARVRECEWFRLAVGNGGKEQ